MQAHRLCIDVREYRFDSKQYYRCHYAHYTLRNINANHDRDVAHDAR
jgi:hypothetical protein